MDITLTTPGPDQLGAVIAALRDWQHEGSPMQLHPGDLGWFQRLGAEATAAAVRMWSGGGRILAVGLLDGDDLLRMTMAPDLDREAAVRIADDLAPSGGVFGAGPATLELPNGALLRDVLVDWAPDEPWSPLRRDLTDPVEDVALHIEVTTPESAAVRAEVHRAAFDRSTFSDERWLAMAAGPAFADARCLIGYDDSGVAVAGITVWSAGPGRPGLIEPMGVHRDHRGHGYGTAISVAGAAALREVGSSSAVVATPSSNVGGIATYRAAGYEPLPERLDLRRPA
ncbi:MAG: Acetyltransferase [Microbacteriaceae bacterium]|nr:Acetyltransferase [Microbacteriaceae bacterium]